MIWVKTDHRSRPTTFISWREDSSEPAEKCGERSWKRRGLDWELALDWSKAEEGRSLAIDLSLRGFSPERLYQIEYLLWSPRRQNEWPEVRGQISGATQVHPPRIAHYKSLQPSARHRAHHYADCRAVRIRVRLLIQPDFQDLARSLSSLVSECTLWESGPSVRMCFG